MHHRTCIYRSKVRECSCKCNGSSSSEVFRAHSRLGTNVPRYLSRPLARTVRHYVSLAEVANSWIMSIWSVAHCLLKSITCGAGHSVLGSYDVYSRPKQICNTEKMNKKVLQRNKSMDMRLIGERKKKKERKRGVIQWWHHGRTKGFDCRRRRSFQ